jgi:hypothetical protein
VDNIKMDLREIGWGDMAYIDLVQDRDRWRALVNTVMKLRVPCNVGKFLSSCTTGCFSRRAQLHEVSISPCSAEVNNGGDIPVLPHTSSSRGV